MHQIGRFEHPKSEWCGLDAGWEINFGLRFGWAGAGVSSSFANQPVFHRGEDANARAATEYPGCAFGYPATAAVPDWAGGIPTGAAVGGAAVAASAYASDQNRA